MTRLIVFMTLALVALALSAGPATAHAATCTTTSIGGEKAPAFAPDGGIYGPHLGGYRCSVRWQAVTYFQYEQNGFWHYACDIPYSGAGCVIFGYNHPDLPTDSYAAGTGHNWTEPDNQPGGQMPVCQYNWRFQVALFNARTNTQIKFLTGPELRRSC